MNIILIGFMGSGKSTMGIRLSYRMKRLYLDTDKMIEKKEGRPISDIFKEEGEAAFRSMESDMIRSLIESGLKDHVIATGGGLPVTEGNAELLKKLGVVVWLRIKPETVIERLSGDTVRPLLKQDDPEKVIRELLAYRAPFYEKCSDVTVDVDGKPVERIMDEIFTKYNGARKKKKKDMR